MSSCKYIYMTVSKHFTVSGALFSENELGDLLLNMADYTYVFTCAV